MQEQDALKIAAEAIVDVRTVKKLAKKGSLQSKLIEGRIRAAAKKLGIKIK